MKAQYDKILLKGDVKLRTFSLVKSLSGYNSEKDYKDMASGTGNTETYSGTHLPYHCGNRNLLAEYTQLLMSKKGGS